MTDSKGRIEKNEHLSSRTEFKKGQVAPNKGRVFTEEWRKKLSKAHKGQVAWNKGLGKPKVLKGYSSGENHWNWKGDSVGYAGIHDWVEKVMGKPVGCENCETLKSKRFMWHNISGDYQRDASDWVRLCATCHNFIHGNAF